MAYEQKEGQGSLFRNEKTNDRQPDFRGTIKINGVTYNVSAWNKVSQNGREFISLQAEDPATRPAPGQYQQQGQYQQPRQPQNTYQAPAYQAPAYQAPAPTAPAPGLDDIIAIDPIEDLPF